MDSLLVLKKIFKNKYTWHKNRLYMPEGAYAGQASRGMSKLCKKTFFKKLKPPTLKTEHQQIRRLKHAKLHGKRADEALTRWCDGYTTASTAIIRIDSVKRFINMCNEKNWLPVATQLPVISPGDCKVATCLDLLLWCDNTQELIVVEIKTGHMNRNYSKGVFNFPFKLVENTQTHQHMLQAHLGCKMFQHTYKEELKNRKVVSCVVYLRDGKNPEIEDYLPTEITSTTEDVWLCFSISARRGVKRKQCTDKKKRKQKKK